MCIGAAHNIGINERETRKKGKAEHRIRLKKRKKKRGEFFVLENQSHESHSQNLSIFSCVRGFLSIALCPFCLRLRVTHNSILPSIFFNSVEKKSFV